MQSARLVWVLSRDRLQDTWCMVVAVHHHNQPLLVVVASSDPPLDIVRFLLGRQATGRRRIPASLFGFSCPFSF